MSTSPTSEIARYSGLYKGQRAGWHRPDVNPALIRYTELLLPAEGRTIFVPLCGKTRDISYFLGLGFRVFGVEGAREAIDDLNTENGFDLEFDPAESTYQTTDGRLQIFLGDFFQCPIEKYGPFEAVWDRGALGTVAYELREQYIAVVRRGLQEKFVYLLEAFEYERGLKSDPPRAFSLVDIQALFSAWATVERLQSVPASERFLSHHTTLQGHECLQNVYIFRNKE